MMSRFTRWLAIIAVVATPVGMLAVGAGRLFAERQAEAEGMTLLTYSPGILLKAPLLLGAIAIVMLPFSVLLDWHRASRRK